MDRENHAIPSTSHSGSKLQLEYSTAIPEGMKCFGLISGMGMEDMAHYVRLINEEVRHRFGNNSSANLVTMSVQTVELAKHLETRDWPKASELFTQAANHLVSLGAQAVLVCSSKMNVAVDGIVAEVPLLQMSDAVIAALRRAKTKRIGLIGTRLVEEEKHWMQRFAQSNVHDVLLPVPRDRQHLSTVLRNELEQGIVTEHSRADLLRVVFSLRQAGARAIVAATPELTTLLEDAVPILPIFDATELHALAAVDWMTAGMGNGWGEKASLGA